MGKDSEMWNKNDPLQNIKGGEAFGLQLLVQIVRDGTTLSLPVLSRVK